MSIRCLICTNYNPCAEHPQDAQDAELRRNQAEVTRILSERAQERARTQSLWWAQGRPYHEPVNDECCPDFSCCFPDLFIKDDAERWRQHANAWGNQ